MGLDGLEAYTIDIQLNVKHVKAKVTLEVRLNSVAEKEQIRYQKRY